MIYQCLNAPYNQWPERFAVAAGRAGCCSNAPGALLASLERLYGDSAPTGGLLMTNDAAAWPRTEGEGLRLGWLMT